MGELQELSVVLDADPDLAFGKALLSATGVLSSSPSFFGASRVRRVTGSTAGGVGVGVSPR